MIHGAQRLTIRRNNKMSLFFFRELRCDWLNLWILYVARKNSIMHYVLLKWLNVKVRYSGREMAEKFLVLKEG